MKRMITLVALTILLFVAAMPAFAGAGGGETTGDTTYTVRPGDTLSQIAALFNTTFDTLARINGIGNANLIFSGEALTIEPETIPTEYTVRFGDTLSQIAARYNTTVSELATLNDIGNVNLIFPGTVLQLPTPTA
jgi:LysM repeat protein